MTTARDAFWDHLRRTVPQAAELSQLNDVSAFTAALQAGADAEQIAQAAAVALGLEYLADLEGRAASADFLSKIPISFARQHGVLGLASGNGVLPVLIGDLRQIGQREILSKMLGRKVVPILAPREAILSAINHAYQQQTGRVGQVIERLDAQSVLKQVADISSREDLLDVASRAPVIQLVNLILFEAVQRMASDVHIQPYEDRLAVRFRIDGVLYDFFSPPKALQEEVVSRIKVMGRMNIAEKRLAQDGRATVEVGDRVIDLRIATLPTSFGERAVIRILDKSVRLYRLPELGMPEAALERFRTVIRFDHGIILVTGPTGSGKSTTLYAALQELNSRESNILTLEDPIEYQLDGISQTQVNERKGMTFARGLRHVLRQDPDVIMVGEIRDADTARMAIQSALTGHLVFSTLHTNDAASAVARMLDLGVEPYLLASSLIGVLAQRLVRQICPDCGQTVDVPVAELQRLGMDDGQLGDLALRQGSGCQSCMGTGFRGRRGIFELMVIDDTLRPLILDRARSGELKTAACKSGMQTLRQDGLQKVVGGVTTTSEVARVTAADES